MFLQLVLSGAGVAVANLSGEFLGQRVVRLEGQQLANLVGHFGPVPAGQDRANLGLHGGDLFDLPQLSFQELLDLGIPQRLGHLQEALDGRLVVVPGSVTASRFIGLLGLGFGTVPLFGQLADELRGLLRLDGEQGMLEVGDWAHRGNRPIVLGGRGEVAGLDHRGFGPLGLHLNAALHAGPAGSAELFAGPAESSALQAGFPKASPTIGAEPPRGRTRGPAVVTVDRGVSVFVGNRGRGVLSCPIRVCLRLQGGVGGRLAIVVH